MTLLTLNAGSSSLKIGVFERHPEGRDDGLVERLSGQVDRLRTTPQLTLKTPKGETVVDQALARPTREDAAHGEALAETLDALRQTLGELAITAVGHRVVHGGPDFAEPVRLTPEIIRQLETLIPLAPLHQPHNLAGIEGARRAFPDAVNVACFDTAFHRHHPWVNDTFALPPRFYEQGVRRYGFHGLSYAYIARRLREMAPFHAAGRVVVAHLGNGASMCAMHDGQSVGSTMGFTAVDGLPMGTRCGQIDPGVLLYLMEQHGMSVAEVTDLLYRDSGLKGMSGISADMRMLAASDDPNAARAVDYFVFRVRRELGALAAVLAGLDAVVFTGGIGQHSAMIRERVLSDAGWLGVELDSHRNQTHATVISSERSRVRVFVLPTDEERMIARYTLGLLGA